MDGQYASLLQSKMSKESFDKLVALDNEKLFRFVGEMVEREGLCLRPRKLLNT